MQIIETIKTYLDPKLDLDIEVFSSIESTNTYLLETDTTHLEKPKLVFAEVQTAGRGRKGRTWVAPKYQNLHFSLLYPMGCAVAKASGFSLVVGLAVAKALENLWVADPKLKWPNDIYLQGKKLGGILIENKQIKTHRFQAVIGIGLNIDMSDVPTDAVSQPFIDLKTVLGRVCCPGELAAEITNQLMPMIEALETKGFAPFESLWSTYDYLLGQSITIEHQGEMIEAVMQGVDPKGGMRCITDDGIQVFYDGEVSPRLSN